MTDTAHGLADTIFDGTPCNGTVTCDNLPATCVKEVPV